MLVRAALVLAASGDVPAAPVLALMGMGVVVAIVGHMARSPRVVAAGIAILFAATILMIIGGLAAFQGDETDPRPPEDPSTPDF
jgi:uncharacterized Zn-binding protein involved in type VI secretion